MQAPWHVFSELESSELIRNLNDAMQSTFVGYMTSCVRLMTEIFITIQIVVAVLLIEPLISSIAIAGITAGCIVVYLLFYSRFKNWGSKMLELAAKRLQWQYFSIYGKRELELLGRQRHALLQYAGVLRDWSKFKALSSLGNEFPRAVIEFFVILTFVGLIAATSVLEFSTESLLPAIGLLGVAGLRVLPAANRIVSFLNSAAASAPAVEIVYAEFSDPRYVWNDPKTTNLSYEEEGGSDERKNATRIRRS